MHKRQYLYEEDGYVFRSYYSDESWTHGKDDLEFDKVVLGNIPLLTSVGKFINGLDPDQLDKIRIYDQYGDLVFDLGHAAEGIDELELYDADNYAVGTGWKVTYGLDEDAADVVYLSVLGDLDGDGKAMASDTAKIAKYLRGEVEFEDDVILAALLCNLSLVHISEPTRRS